MFTLLRSHCFPEPCLSLSTALSSPYLISFQPLFPLLSAGSWCRWRSCRPRRPRPSRPRGKSGCKGHCTVTHTNDMTVFRIVPHATSLACGQGALCDVAAAAPFSSEKFHFPSPFAASAAVSSLLSVPSFPLSVLVRIVSRHFQHRNRAI